MTLVHLTPLPPERTGVADANARLLAAVAEQVPVTAYSASRADPIPGVKITRANRLTLKRASRAPAVVAQIGNSLSHAWILEALRRRPMIVELHDLVLHHLVAAMEFRRGAGEGYLDAMERDAGIAGRIVAQASLDGRLPPMWEAAPELYPLTAEALKHASAVIVHSDFAADLVRKDWPELDVRVVPLLPPDVSDAAPERPVDVGAPVIGCFGFVTPAKRVDAVMRAVKSVRATRTSAHLLIVGAPQPGVDLRAMARAAALDKEALTVVDYAPGDRFAALMAGVDIGVNLRHPTMGETSATAVQLLTAGKPLIVSDGGWYDEIPDEAVLRIAPDADEVRSLTAALGRLLDSPSLRREMGEAGRTWRTEVLAPERIADAHLLATLGLAGHATLASDVTTELGLRMAEVSDRRVREVTGLPAYVARAGAELGIL